VSRILVRLAVLLVLAGCAAPTPGRSGAPPVSSPRFNASGPHSDVFGARDGFSMGNRNTYYTIPFLVGSHSHLDQLFPHHVVRRAATSSPFGRPVAEPAISHTVDHYLARNPTTGLLIARGDTILIERYQYDRTDRHRFISWSMAKTVTAMLIGVAIADGRIGSVDDLAAAYVPRLDGTEYGNTSIRHLLQMSSGVRFREEYSGRDDVATLSELTFRLQGRGGVDAVLPFNTRTAPAGTRFSYASVETQVLGLVLRAAVGRPVAEYMHEKIGEPIGAEGDATWLVDKAGQEATYCCLNAALRDYARLGLLLANEGNWRGRQIIPAAWVRDATTVRGDQPHLRPGTARPSFGYGYQTWIFPGERRQFAFRGVRGQAIFVDPQSRLVFVPTGRADVTDRP
jgi:CubicO group peptidase (beta-lactamase class C family)